MVRNARPPVFHPPWLPSRAARLAAFRKEQERVNPRPAAAARGYDQDWARLRAAHLADEPYCPECARLGRETLPRIADHIVPVRDAPERRLDPSNVQSLCVPHHQSKIQRERNRAGRNS